MPAAWATPCEVFRLETEIPFPTGSHPWPSNCGRPLRLRRPDLIAKAPKSMHTFDLAVAEAGLFSSTSLPQLAAVELLPRAKNEVWILGPQTPGGGRRATRVDVPAASAPPSPSTLCALSAQAIHAAPGQPDREGRGWYPL